MGLEVGLVGVLPLEGVEDRVLRPQPQRGGHLAELQVEVDDAHPSLRVAGEEVGQVGGVEGLAAAAGGGRDRVHGGRPAGRGGRGAAAAGAWATVVAGAGAGQLDAALDGLGQLLVVDGELEQVDGAGAHDVAEAGVGTAAEGQHEAHGRQLLADQPEPGEARPGAQAGAGHQHVEGTVALQDLGHRARPASTGRSPASGVTSAIATRSCSASVSLRSRTRILGAGNGIS